jgi:hypothetical protein
VNYYTIASATEYLKCTKKDSEKLIKLLESDEYGCGVSVYYSKEAHGILIFAEEHFIPEELNDKILGFIAVLLKRQKKQYLEFGIAYTADKVNVNGVGGSSCIITDEGKVIYRTPVSVYQWANKDKDIQVVTSTM